MKSFLNKNWDGILGLLLLVVCFYLGRYTAPTKVETKTVAVEVEKVKTNQNVVIVEKINKDGSRVKITQSSSQTYKNTETSVKNSKVVENKPSVNIHAMAGLDVLNPKGVVVGVHANKQILGPISLGVFGFTNNVIGLSLGMSL
jgi:hypothetical protein